MRMADAFLAVVSMSALGLSACAPQARHGGSSSTQVLPELLELLVARAPSLPVSPAAPPVLQPPLETDLDRAIRVALGRELLQEAGLDNRDVRISVNNGDVTVTGMVKTEDERRKVNELAMNVAGVKSVANALTVSP